MNAQPVKSVFRSATMSLRKADLAREEGDDDEQLVHLKAFVHTVRRTLRRHPMYARRRGDPEAVALDENLPKVIARIRDLGDDVSSSEDDEPPPRPDPPAKGASPVKRMMEEEEEEEKPKASSLLARKKAAGGALLSRSRANSRANSRAPSPTGSDDEGPEGGARDGAPARPAGDPYSASVGNPNRPAGSSALMRSRRTSGNSATGPTARAGAGTRDDIEAAAMKLRRHKVESEDEGEAATLKRPVGSTTLMRSRRPSGNSATATSARPGPGSHGDIEAAAVKLRRKVESDDEREAASSKITVKPRHHLSPRLNSSDGSAVLRKPPPGGPVSRRVAPRRSRDRDEIDEPNRLRDDGDEGSESPTRSLSDSEIEMTPAKVGKSKPRAASTEKRRSPSSAEKYGSRVEREVARLREEAEAQRIAALERKVEIMRARMDAGARTGIMDGILHSPARSAGPPDRERETWQNAAAWKPSRAPSTAAAAAAAVVSAKPLGEGAKGDISLRLGTVESELFKLRSHIAHAAANHSGLSSGGAGSPGSVTGGGVGLNPSSAPGPTRSSLLIVGPPGMTPEAVPESPLSRTASGTASTTGPGPSSGALRAERELDAVNLLPTRDANYPGAWIRRGEAEASPSEWNMHGGIRVRSQSSSAPTMEVKVAALAPNPEGGRSPSTLGTQPPQSVSISLPPSSILPPPRGDGIGGALGLTPVNSDPDSAVEEGATVGNVPMTKTSKAAKSGKTKKYSEAVTSRGRSESRTTTTARRSASTPAGKTLPRTSPKRRALSPDPMHRRSPRSSVSMGPAKVARSSLSKAPLKSPRSSVSKAPLKSPRSSVSKAPLKSPRAAVSEAPVKSPRSPIPRAPWNFGTSVSGPVTSKSPTKSPTKTATKKSSATKEKLKTPGEKGSPPPYQIASLPSTSFPAPPPMDALSGLAAAAASAAMEATMMASTNNTSPLRAPTLATMEGAKAAAAAAAEAAAEAVGERVRRELRAVSERQDALSRRAQAEMEAVVTQVLPLHEENSTLRHALDDVETRLEVVETRVKASESAGNAGASALAAAAAAAADVEALRGQVLRQQTASQEWTEQAIVQQGEHHWGHVQRLLIQRDKDEQERTIHLQQQLDEVREQQVAWQVQAREHRERQEAAAEVMRQQVLEAHAAVNQMRAEMARQAEQIASQVQQQKHQKEQQVARERHQEAMKEQQEEWLKRLRAESDALASATAVGDSAAAFAAQINHILRRIEVIETAHSSPPSPPSPVLGRSAATVLYTPPGTARGDGGGGSVVELPADVAATPRRIEELERRVSALAATPALQAPLMVPPPAQVATLGDVEAIEKRIRTLETHHLAPPLPLSGPSQSEFELLKERVRQIESVKTPSPRRSPTGPDSSAIAEAAEAVTTVRALEKKISRFEARVAKTEKSAAEAAAVAADAKAAAEDKSAVSPLRSPTRPDPSAIAVAADAVAKVAGLEQKISKFEARVAKTERSAADATAAAADAKAAASVKSPGSKHAKEAVAIMRARLSEMEVEVAGRLTEVETRLSFLAESTSEVAAAAAALAPTLPLPPPLPLPESHLTMMQEEQEEKMKELVMAAEGRVLAEVETAIGQIQETAAAALAKAAEAPTVEDVSALQRLIEQLDESRQSAAEANAKAVAEVVAAAAGAVESQQRLTSRVIDLEEAGTRTAEEHAKEGANVTKALSLVDERMTAIESVMPPPSPLTGDELLALAKSVQDGEREIQELRDSRLRDREADEEEKRAVSSVTARVSSMAAETKKAVDALAERLSDMEMGAGKAEEKLTDVFALVQVHRRHLRTIFGEDDIGVGGGSGNRLDEIEGRLRRLHTRIESVSETAETAVEQQARRGRAMDDLSAEVTELRQFRTRDAERIGSLETNVSEAARDAKAAGAAAVEGATEVQGITTRLSTLEVTHAEFVEQVELDTAELTAAMEVNKENIEPVVNELRSRMELLESWRREEAEAKAEEDKVREIEAADAKAKAAGDAALLERLEELEEIVKRPPAMGVLSAAIAADAIAEEGETEDTGDGPQTAEEVAAVVGATTQTSPLKAFQSRVSGLQESQRHRKRLTQVVDQMLVQRPPSSPQGSPRRATSLPSSGWASLQAATAFTAGLRRERQNSGNSVTSVATDLSAAAAVAAASTLEEEIRWLSGRVQAIEKTQERQTKEMAAAAGRSVAANADAASAAANAEAASHASVGAAAAAAEAAETLALELDKLRGQLEELKVKLEDSQGKEPSSPPFASVISEPASISELPEGAVQPPQPKSGEKEHGKTDLERLADLDEGELLKSPRPRGLGTVPSPSTRTHFHGVTSEEAAKAAASLGGELKEGDLDPVARARERAANARRIVHEEAAKLGINLGDSSPKDSPTGGGLAVNPEALASAADRKLAAELATVCALVESEEARRLQLQGKEVDPTNKGGATDVLLEMQAAQRRWEGAMEVQLRRLRKAAHEAEERNAVAAAVSGRDSLRDVQHGGQSGRHPGDLHGEPFERGTGGEGAERKAREAALAARLSYLHERVGAMVLAERDQGSVSTRGNLNNGGLKKPHKGQSSGSHPPWGAGPGLKSPVKGAKIHPQGLSGVLTELEEGVKVLAGRRTRKAALGIEEMTEVKSLQNMVQSVQIEIGGLTGRIDAVDQRTTGAGRAEQDLWRAQLSEVRGDIKSLKRCLSKAEQTGEVALERASNAENAAAGARAGLEELGTAVASTRADTVRLRERVDALAHGAEAGLRAVDGKVDRVKASVRGAKAAARMSEARAVALAGEVGRMARHVGLEGVGDALRTGVLFAPPPLRKNQAQTTGVAAGVLQEDDDLFEIDVMGERSGGSRDLLVEDVGGEGDSAPPAMPSSPERTTRMETAPASRPSRRVTWEVDATNM